VYVQGRPSYTETCGHLLLVHLAILLVYIAYDRA